MEKLEQLFQDEEGRFYHADKRPLWSIPLPVGKIRTLTLENPSDVPHSLDGMFKRKSSFIPERANAYVTSEFCGDTQHFRSSNLDVERKFYSVYAVQFYDVLELGEYFEY